MTDEEIIELAEKTYKDKPQEGCVFCDDCPMFICANSKECVLTAHKQGFLDGFKVALGLLPRFKPKNIGCIDEWIEKFKNNPQLQQSYIEELEKTIKKISIANE